MTGLPDREYQAEFYDSVAPKRLMAWVVDSILIVGLSLLAVLLTAFVGLLIWPLLYLVIGFVYRTVTLANGSATLGMRFCGIELRDLSGRRLDAGQATWHTALYTVCLSVPILQLISIIMMLTTHKGQGLNDSLLGTVMINRRS
ncbi:RDD family protein [Pseudophaeobacter leonis]|uniref:RDD family protein n=1 Tax=Pseudophaeobacter leonis TaxID=1144477 RepID=UPI0009F724E7|nr:RDD family protein [Pseudophaeobacter leonis]